MANSACENASWHARTYVSQAVGSSETDSACLRQALANASSRRAFVARSAAVARSRPRLTIESFKRARPLLELGISDDFSSGNSSLITSLASGGDDAAGPLRPEA